MNFEDLDKLFRNKLGQKRAEFDEGAWAEMEDILKKRRRGRRFTGWWTILPLLLVGSIGGYLVLEKDSILKKLAISQPKQTINAGKLQINKDSSNDGRGSPMSPLLTGALMGQPKIDKQNRSADESSSNQSNSPSNSTRGEETLPKHASSQDVSNTATAQNQARKSGYKQRVSKPNDPKRDKSQPQTEIFDKAMEVAGVKESANQLTFAKLPTKDFQLERQALSPQEANTLVDSLKLNPDIHETFAFGLSGGAQFTSEPNGDAFSNLSAEPLVGGYVRWHLGADWFLNAEVLYHYDQSPAYQETVTQRSYNFGFKAKSTTVALDQIHYLELPVYLDYELFGSHGVIGGLKGSYLVTGTGTVTQKQFSSLDKGPTSSQNTQIQPNSLKTWQLQGVLGYRFDYNDQIRLQLRGVFGPGRVKQSASDASVAQDQNIGVQLLLQYQLN